MTVKMKEAHASFSYLKQGLEVVKDIWSNGAFGERYDGLVNDLQRQRVIFSLSSVTQSRLRVMITGLEHSDIELSLDLSI